MCVCVCVLQVACPASTELEIIVMDWLGKMLQLPSDFLSEGKGGGIIQVSIVTIHIYTQKQLVIQCKICTSFSGVGSFMRRFVIHA